MTPVVAAAAASSETARSRLLDAAVRVFSERGYDGAGVQEIARRAGLTTGAIYANFRGKANLLFEAIGSRSADELDELLQPRTVHGTAGELLAELGSHLLDKPRDPAYEGLLIEAFVAARRDDDLAGLVRSLVDERSASIGAIVERGQHDGSFAPEVSGDALTTFSLLLALGSLLYTSLGVETPPDDEWAALIRRIVQSFKENPSRES